MKPMANVASAEREDRHVKVPCLNLARQEGGEAEGVAAYSWRSCCGI